MSDNMLGAVLGLLFVLFVLFVGAIVGAIVYGEERKDVWFRDCMKTTRPIAECERGYLLLTGKSRKQAGPRALLHGVDDGRDG